MKYIAKYLPVDKPWTDGCTIINSSGEHHVWEEYSLGWPESQWRVAELFIVASEFNQHHIVCVPSEETKKWLKPGMEVSSFNIVQNEDDLKDKNWNEIRHIKCPTCGHYPGKK